MFQYVSCVCNLQLTADVDLLQCISISFLLFLVLVEDYTGRHQKKQHFCEKLGFQTIAIRVYVVM
jgi:hypothetical protein